MARKPKKTDVLTSRGFGKREELVPRSEADKIRKTKETRQDGSDNGGKPK